MVLGQLDVHMQKKYVNNVIDITSHHTQKLTQKGSYT